MTESDPNQLPDPDPDSATTPPYTGHAAVDDALLGLGNLALAPLADHHDQLAKAHEVLQEALDRRDDDRSEDAGQAHPARPQSG
jgi:hypothetical protein